MRFILKYACLCILLYLSFVVKAEQRDTARVNFLNDSSYYLGSLFPERAFEVAVQSRALAKELNYTEGEILALCRMGNAVRKNNKLDSALYYYNQAEQLFYEKGKDSSLLGRIYIYQGPVYRRKGMPEMALAKYRQLYQLALKHEDKILLGSTLINMSLIFKTEGKYKNALGLLNHALDILPVDNYNEIGAVYNSIANIYQDMGRTNEAIDVMYKAQEFFLQGGDFSNLIKTQINLGNFYRDLNLKERALFTYREIYPVTVQRKFEEQEATVCQNMGELFLEQGKIDSAEKYFNRSLLLNRAADDLDGELASLISAGEILLLKEDTDSAIILFLEAYDLAFQFESLEDLIAVTAQLSNGYRKKENLLLANQYQEELIFYQDSLHTLMTEGLVYEIQYEKEKRKVSELELLVKEQSHQLEKQSNTIWSVIGIALAIVILLYMLVRLNIQRRRVVESEKKNLEKQKEISELINKQEQAELDAMYNGQENERNRIAAELHDNLGGILSTVKLYFKSMDKQIDQLKEENIKQFYKANKLLDDACDQTRKIAHELSSSKLGQVGLFETVRILQYEINGSGQIRVNLNTYGSNEALIHLNQLSVYRVVQELVTNILRHPHATEINIQLNVFDKLFNLIIEDDGTGFDLNKVRTNTGIGLRETEERVRNMSGKMTIDSGRGGGTTITIDIPLKTKE